jgi:hypothetical protein
MNLRQATMVRSRMEQLDSHFKGTEKKIIETKF